MSEAWNWIVLAGMMFLVSSLILRNVYQLRDYPRDIRNSSILYNLTASPSIFQWLLNLQIFPMNISHSQWYEAKDSYSNMIRKDEPNVQWG